MYQTTLAEPFFFEGVGLHSGKLMKTEVLPAPADTGVRFSRADVFNCPFVHVTPEGVSSTQLATTLTCGSFPISTIEHLTSALYGMGVDNALIKVYGAEVPILDGSARPIAELIARAGIIPLNQKRLYLNFSRPVSVEDEDKSVSAIPDHRFSISFELNYPQKEIGRRKKSFVLTPELYFKTVSGARTFGFAQEVEMLMKMGLARGGSIENAVVLGKDGETLNPEGLRHKEELVLHKILDLIGDISLIGYRLCGNIRAVKSGHGLNNKFARKVGELLNSFTLSPANDEVSTYGYLNA